MARLLLICLGGAIGTGARYLLSGWMLQICGASFAYGTLSVNVLGSFLLSIIMYLGVEASVIPPTLRLVLATGVMGGFTTYSTFSYETMKYLQDGAWAIGLLNVAATVFGCFAASVMGWAAARWLMGV